MSKMSVIYWSQTGNTEAMARAVAEGAQAAGAEVKVLEVSQASGSDVQDFESIEGSLSGKKVALFGSYGWGDGQWMRDWWDRAGKDGAKLYGDEGLIINETPDDAGLEQCRSFGGGFAGF